jgi:type II secretory pathway component GspD/PulD (secretin)
MKDEAHPFLRGLLLFLAGAVVALVGAWLAWSAAQRRVGPQKHTFSSFDPPRGAAAAMQFDTGMLNLAEADLDQVLHLYQEVSARTVIGSPHLPSVKISLHNQTPLTRVETLQLLDTTLEQNGITMVLVGDLSVKAVPNGQARSETPPTIDLMADELPASSSYMTCTVRLRYANVRDMADVLNPMSRMQKSIVCLPAEKLIILFDYAANIRQMRQTIQELDRLPLHWPDIVLPTTNAAGKKK